MAKLPINSTAITTEITITDREATPIPHIHLQGSFLDVMASLPDGITYLRRDGQFGSGNFVGFIQSRQLIKNHDKSLF